jgi:glutamate dehydrogenase/leucine dehydrogenase
VGTFAFTYLTHMGANVVAIADKDGAIYSEKGLDPLLIKDMIKQKKPVVEYKGGAKKILPEDFWKLGVDILIPASVTDVINEKNKKDIKAKIIVEAGNIPMQEKIEDELFKKGIIIVPDFVANAGGVISSYAEYRGYNPKQMFKTVRDKIVLTTNLVMGESIKKGINPRRVAMQLARKRVTK